jgi:hypothetical protein
VVLLGSQYEEVEAGDREELGCGSEARAERKPCDLPRMAEVPQIEADYHPWPPLVAAGVVEGRGLRLGLRLTLLEAASAAQGPRARRIFLHQQTEVVH